MKIGELALATGLAPSAIRYYEQSGLLPAGPREANGYRSYGEDAVRRLKLIAMAQRLGFSLDSLRTAFATDDANFPKDELMARLDARLAEIDTVMATLRAQRQDLRALRDKLGKSWVAGECLSVDELAQDMVTAKGRRAKPAGSAGAAKGARLVRAAR
jgi:DNA-binding transcriptional MerR regulator